MTEVFEATNYDELSILEKGERFRRACEMNGSNFDFDIAKDCLEESGIASGPFSLINSVVAISWEAKFFRRQDFIGPEEERVPQLTDSRF